MTEATQPLLPVTLKERRERLGLTLRDVEEISKGAISNSYLSQLETGKIKSPSLENARILATIYYCQTDDIAEALSLPIPAVPFRCHCCGQSLLHAKFITDTDDGIVSTSDTLARRMGGRFVPAALTPSALSPEPVQKELPEGHRWCRHCEQKDRHCSVCEGVGYLPNTTPSALSGDAGEGET